MAKYSKFNIDSEFKKAVQYHRSGELEKAERIYKKILKINPNHSESLHQLGVVAIEVGKNDIAVDLINKAIKNDPKNPIYYNSLGIAFWYQGKLNEAISCFQRALQLKPDYFKAYSNMGNAFRDQGKLNEAISCFQRALQLKPDFADAHYNLGTVLQDKGQLDDAANYYQKALKLNPNLSEAYFNLGTVLQDKGQLDDAVNYYQKAIQLNPNLAGAYVNLGNALKDKKQLDRALICYQKAIELNPNIISAYSNLGNIFREQYQLTEAITYYQKALQLNPNLVNINIDLGNTYIQQGRLTEAEIYLRRALQLEPDNVLAYDNLLGSMNYNPNHNPQTVFKEHMQFAKQCVEPLSALIAPHGNEKSLNRQLKIGYISPDFRRHAVAYFIEPVIIAHNRDHFEIFCYSNNLKHDEVTKRFQEYADQWRNIAGASDNDVIERIRKDQIDILVDLAGHTANNRILVFARKPAPIQVSWIGYFATTGLSTMDYKITDNYADPQGKTEQFHTEKLMRLPESFLCYLPDRESPEAEPLPALSKGHITFGSFNNFAKVTSEVFSLWSKILKELPDSRLILKGKSFHDKAIYQYAKNMLIQRGIAAERIILQSWDPSPKHLESYNLVDIGLDTFPFNGATTTCEAIWMGVPVVTLEGTAYNSRVGISLLSNIGLKEFIAQTPEEYVEIAVNLAKDIQRLQYLREHLRDMMIRSPLCNAKKFTANLEICYRKMWETWCQSV